MNNKFWEVVGVSIVLLGLLGWAMNLVAIAQADYIDGLVVVRVIGVLIAPLGAILGYI
jgi:hypothetical protein